MGLEGSNRGSVSKVGPGSFGICRLLPITWVAARHIHYGLGESQKKHMTWQFPSSPKIPSALASQHFVLS